MENETLFVKAIVIILIIVLGYIAWINNFGKQDDK